MFTLGGNHKTVSQRVCLYLFVFPPATMFMLLHVVTKSGVVRDLDFGPNRCVVASCYCFNVHFPYDKWCETSIHLLTFHLHSLSPEMTFKVLGPFLNNVVCFSYSWILTAFFFFFFFGTFWGTVLYHMYILQVFSLTLWLVSFFWNCISGIRTSWCWWSLLFLSQIMPLMLYLKSSSFPRSSKFFPVILQKLYSFAFYTRLSLS